MRFIDGNRRLQIAGVSLPSSCLTCDIYDRVRVRETRRRSSGDYEDYEDEEDDIPQFRAGVVYIIPMAR